jgi:hypothetical protein
MIYGKAYFISVHLLVLYSTHYCADDEIEEKVMGGACSVYGGWARRVQGLVGKPEGKRPLGRLRRRWEGNIKMDL